jgi:hypothetical protein
MKNFSYTVGNRPSVLPACSTVPQPTALPLNPTPAYVVYIVEEAAVGQDFLRVISSFSVSFIVIVLNNCSYVYSFIHSSTIDAILFYQLTASLNNTQMYENRNADVLMSLLRAEFEPPSYCPSSHSS